MFLQNKYTNCYYRIIDRAIREGRTKLKRTDVGYVYYERHHIIPRCLDGGDGPDNLVLLTAKEHYVVHHLLCYMVSETRPKILLLNAFVRMAYSKSTGQKRHTPRSYDAVKRLISEKNSLAFRGKKKSVQMRQRLSRSRKGMKFTNQHRQRLSEVRRGRKHTNAYKRKMALACGAREVLLQAPDGSVHQMVNQKQFCQDHSLDRATINKLVAGKRKQHKGWKLYGS